jgi:hypothetical protein
VQSCLAREESALTYAEIAARLNLTEAAVKMAVHRLRGRHRGVLRRAMQPTGQDGALRELSRTLRQRHKHALRHIFSQMCIPNHAQGSGIDQVNMPSDQFAERRFCPALGVFLQQLLVGQIVHSLDSNRRRSNRTSQGWNSGEASKGAWVPSGYSIQSPSVGPLPGSGLQGSH